MKWLQWADILQIILSEGVFSFITISWIVDDKYIFDALYDTDSYIFSQCQLL